VLRRVLLVLAAAVFALGLGLLLRGIPAPGWNLLVLGAVFLLALVFERWRYRNQAGPQAGAWSRTGERFEDPESGQVMEVLFDPASGQRRYVKADQTWRAPHTETKGPS